MKKFLLILPVLFLFVTFQSVSAQKKTSVRFISCDACRQEVIYIPKPKYPEAAKFRVGGSVRVEILIDEKGKVESAKVISGHPFFRAEAIKSALRAKFQPYKVSGKPVKARGIIVFLFVP